jgi:hypothetical protein
MQLTRWNPDEDMELPIWHPAHFVHQQHLAVSAQLVKRRCSIEDVEDFLVGVGEITPQWTDRMLRPLVESASRRKVVQRALANKTKKNLSAYEWDLLNWNVDVDTRLDWAVERAMEARERIPADTPLFLPTGYAGNLEASGPASTASISPYFKWVWGVTQEDVDSIARNRYLVIDVPDFRVRNVIQICFREPLHNFFTRSTFIGDAPGVSTTNIFSWGKVASLWGYPRPQDENTPSAPFMKVFERGLVDWNVRPIIETMYRSAQEELARATAIVSLHYAMEYGPGGAISLEQRRAAGEHRKQRYEKLKSRKHSAWKAGGYRDTPVDVVASYYADVFGVM